MSAVYFDASAIVKLLINEQDSAVADALWAGAGSICASELTYVEGRAAIATAERTHRLTPKAHATASTFLKQLRPSIHAIAVTGAIATHAGDLAQAHALKGADAVHLASALAVQDPDLVVATWDRRLHDAARAEGLRVAPKTIPS